jgi:hypothetical protein
MTASFSESVVEDAALSWLGEARWPVAHGTDIAPDTAGAERARITARWSWNSGCAPRWRG